MTISDKDFHALLVTAPAKPESLKILRDFAEAFLSSNQGVYYWDLMEYEDAKLLALAVADLLR